MSTEEQQAAIGRTMEEYVARKRKLAALQAECTNFGDGLTQLGQTLRTIDKYIAGNIGNAVSAVNHGTMNFPTADSP
jgi:hypothetical protein